jgi:hypothetical protein
MPTTQAATINADLLAWLNTLPAKRRTRKEDRNGHHQGYP